MSTTIKLKKCYIFLAVILLPFIMVCFNRLFSFYYNKTHYSIEAARSVNYQVKLLVEADFLETHKKGLTMSPLLYDTINNVYKVISKNYLIQPDSITKSHWKTHYITFSNNGEKTNLITGYNQEMNKQFTANTVPIKGKLTVPHHKSKEKLNAHCLNPLSSFALYPTGPKACPSWNGSAFYKGLYKKEDLRFYIPDINQVKVYNFNSPKAITMLTTKGNLYLIDTRGK